ncbi:hypothetical protein BGX29_000105, partial [Mortierella sp. GBA35]
MEFDDSNALRKDSFCSIVEHCPQLTTISLPRIEPREDFNAVAASLVQSCPRLRNTSHSNGSHDKEGALVFAIAGAMVEDTLESIYFRGLDEKEHRLEQAARRHFGSLRRVVLDVCSNIQTKSLQTILFNCSMLEELEVSGDDPDRFKISLEDVVAETWASRRLKQLYLVIDIGDTSTLLQDRSDPTKLDDRRKGLLNKLFQQIGVQTELKILELRVSLEDDILEEDEFLTHKDFFFPRMMWLEDESSDRHGFLGLLRGLTKLEILRELVILVGSFLDRKDLARLMQTSYPLYALASPWCYPEIDINLPDHARMLATPARLDAFLKDFRHLSASDTDIANHSRNDKSDKINGPGDVKGSGNRGDKRKTSDDVLPRITDQGLVKAVARAIVENCPNLRGMYQQDSYPAAMVSTGALIVAVMEGMAEQTFEKFYCTELKDENGCFTQPSSGIP